MAEGMYGAPIGEQAYLNTALKALQVGTQAQHTLGEIAKQPDERRLLRVKADLGELELKEEKLWQALMQTAATGQPPAFTGPTQPDPAGAAQEATTWQNQPAAMAATGVDTVKKMENLAELAAQQGMGRKSLKILEQTSQIRQRQASEASARSTQALNMLKFLREDAENLAQFFGGARDQEGLDRANALYQFQTGKPSPLQNLPYDAGLIASVNQRALSAKERYQLAETEAHHRATETHQSGRRDQHDATRKIQEERLTLEREREARLKKQGEVAAEEKRRAGRRVETRQEDKDLAGQLLRKDFPTASTADPDAYRNARDTVASEATSILRRNPALSRSQAVAQAYTQARQAGDFEFEEGHFGTKYGAKFKFTGGGRSAETALPMPSSAAEAKTGRYYLNAKGQIGRWDGKQFQPVQ